MDVSLKYFNRTDKWLYFSEEELEKYSYRPIFIVGSPRSGTTLMRSIIDAHPNIFCPPCETFIFNNLNSTFNGYIWSDHFSQLPFSRGALIKWLRKYVLDLFANLACKANKKRWAEKTPSHVFFMEFINEVFQEVQFIHLIRNGHDVVRSLKSVPWGSRKTVQNINTWIRSVTEGRRVGKKISKEKYIEIKYEDLINHFEPTLKILCSFLGEDFDERMLHYYLPENNSWGLDLLSFEEGKKRRGNYKDLNLYENYIFKLKAGSLMHELEYL